MSDEGWQGFHEADGRDDVVHLVDAYEQRFSTDFALLGVTQGTGQFELPAAWCYATSQAGAIGMMCGTKHASVDIRLERWTERPPDEAPGWEDRDELPFEAVEGAGAALASGFDGAESTGLDLGGLGRARVRVLAWGRHRYDDVDPEAELDPERWLVQFWPDPENRDGLFGPPRRVAGPLPFEVRRTAWQAAFHAWDQTGWTQLLRGLHDFTELRRMFDFVGEPRLASELPALISRTEDHPLHDPSDRDADYLSELQTHLARAAGLSQVDTLGDLLVAMQRVGLLATIGDRSGRVIPNPVPPPVWIALGLNDERSRYFATQTLQADFHAIQWDLFHLAYWAPDRVLRARPRQIAIRLAVPANEVIGGLRLLQANHRILAEQDLGTVVADDVIEVALPR